MRRCFAILIVSLLLLHVGTVQCCEGCDDMATCTIAAACKACVAQGIVPAAPALLLVPKPQIEFSYLPLDVRLPLGDIWRPPLSR